MILSQLYLKNEDTGDFIPASRVDLHLAIQNGTGRIQLCVTGPDVAAAGSGEQSTPPSDQEDNAPQATSQVLKGRVQPRVGGAILGGILSQFGQALLPLLPTLEQALIKALEGAILKTQPAKTLVNAKPSAN